MARRRKRKLSKNKDLESRNDDTVTAHPDTLLLDLPPELVEMIAEYLAPGNDLLNLRLVNKEIAACSEKVMLRTHFSHLKILFSVRKSFCYALNIVQHPKLRAAVRSITVYAGQFARQALEDRAFPGTSAPSREDKAGVEKHREWRRRFFELVEDQDQMFADYEDLFYMYKIFFPLRCLAQHISVQIAALRHSQLERLLDGHGELAGGTGDALARAIMHKKDDFRPLTSALCEIEYTKDRVTSFSAGDADFTIPLRLFDPAWRSKDMWVDLQNITSLSLIVGLSSRILTQQDREAASAGFVAFLQSLSSHLKRLDLRYHERRLEAGESIDNAREDRRHVNETFDRVCSAVNFSALEHFTLVKMEARYSSLIRFLKQFASTLQRFRIEAVSIVGCPLPMDGVCRAQFYLDLQAAAGLPMDAGIISAGVDGEWS